MDDGDTHTDDSPISDAIMSVTSLTKTGQEELDIASSIQTVSIVGGSMQESGNLGSPEQALGEGKELAHSEGMQKNSGDEQEESEMAFGTPLLDSTDVSSVVEESIIVNPINGQENPDMGSLNIQENPNNPKNPDNFSSVDKPKNNSQGLILSMAIPLSWHPMSSINGGEVKMVVDDELPVVTVEDMDISGKTINNSDDNYSDAATKALSNELIVEKILESFNNFYDLKELRRLNPTFQSLATKKMRPLTVLKSTRLEYRKMVYKKNDPDSGKDTTALGFLSSYHHKFLVFAELNSLLRNSKAFPFDGLRLNTYMWDLKNPEVIKFFKEFGSEFKTLSLEKTGMKMEDLEDVLLVRVPQVEEIIVTNDFKVKSQEHHIFLHRNSDVETVEELPNVQDVRLVCDDVVQERNLPILKNLVEAASNLRVIHGCNILLLSEIKANKLGALKSLNFEPFPNWRYYDKIAQAGLTLRKLSININVQFEGIFECLSRILGEIILASQNTLEIIELISTVRQLPTLILPVLPRIKELRMSDLYAFGSNKWLSNSVGTTFPNLNKVIVDQYSITSTGHFRLKFLPEDTSYSRTPVPSVKELALEGGLYNVSSLLFLESKFPNAKTIRVNWTGSFRLNKYLLWSLPKQVESLELFCVNLDNFSNYRFDSFLTGIPFRICGMLQKMRLDDVDFKQFQKNDSILLLKNLKKLTIHCVDVEKKDRLWHDEKLRGIPCVSEISKKLIFDVMPDLHVKFIFPKHYRQCLMIRERELLQAIAPFITISYKCSPS